MLYFRKEISWPSEGHPEDRWSGRSAAYCCSVYCLIKISWRRSSCSVHDGREALEKERGGIPGEGVLVHWDRLRTVFVQNAVLFPRTYPVHPAFNRRVPGAARPWPGSLKRRGRESDGGVL